jgi:hypothetical protein
MLCLAELDASRRSNVQSEKGPDLPSLFLPQHFALGTWTRWAEISSKSAVTVITATIEGSIRHRSEIASDYENHEWTQMGVISKSVLFESIHVYARFTFLEFFIESQRLNF